MLSITPRTPAWAAVLCALFVAGCGRDDVKVYQVKKEPAVSPHAAASPHGDMQTMLPKVTYNTPSGWTEQSPSSMRAASFSISGPEGQTADVGVIPLQGVTGRDLEMVNMWRTQVALSPVEAEELNQLTTRVAIGPAEGKLFDMVSKEPLAGQKTPIRILSAMLDHEGTGWFFKMTGPDELVVSQRVAFQDFLKSIEFGKAEAASPHAAVRAASGGGVGADAGGGGKPTWAVPAGWQEAPGGQFLTAKFNLSGEGSAQASVNVSASTGEGGGWVGNVNRWRGQLGLSEMSVEEVTKATTSVEITGGRAMMVSLAGTDARNKQPAALVGVMVLQSGQSWFYKLMGDPKVVEGQKDAFTQFVKSVQY